MAPSAEDRSGEIWATRIQQELLALTTDNADMESTEVRSMLPPFATVKEHTLDIAAGSCVVTVQVDVISGKGEEATNCSVLVAIEASLNKNMDGSVNPKDPSYPFVPPVVRLMLGKTAFPPGSTIDEGDRINMDLDWTPSLHLTDAILNISLKIRESILQAEPFHAAEPEDPIAEVVADVTRGARRFASKIGSLGKAFSPKASSSAPRTPQSSGSNQSKSSTVTVNPAMSPGDVKIGDEINLLEEPWVAAHGVYSCKAIRRPPFIEEIMASAQKKEEQFSSPTAMLRSFAQSARSVMEESFLMITDTHIIELRASKLNMQLGTVAFCIPIELMSKLKFRRQESVSLFFKTAPEDPLIYMCADSGDAVHQIQSVLKQKGVRGKHTNAAAYRAINEALEMVKDIQSKESALDHEPTVERVNEIMDLYRQAAEKFESAGDIRHEEVVTHMRKFLAKPSTIGIIDGSHKPQALSPMSGNDELDRTDAQLDGEDDSVVHQVTTPSSANDKEFVETIDNLMKDVKQDFENFELDDDDALDMDKPSPEFSGDGIDEMAADLDAMMKEADKELAELMSS